MTFLRPRIGGGCQTGVSVTLYSTISYENELGLARFVLYIVSDENEPDRKLGAARDWSSGVDERSSPGFSSPGSMGSD